jgi:hypothetical protein
MRTSNQLPCGYNPSRGILIMEANHAMSTRKLNSSYIVPVALLLVASALAYLPNLLQATVYRDDWYYVLDRIIGGPGVFQAMFSVDRPARGPFFELYYLLFGVNPLPYHVASYVWRFLGGLAALWLFRLLWPTLRRATLWMALMFVLFPGYLRWMEGFEDQPRIASVCLMALSFALTLKAIGSTRILTKVGAWLGSILAGWAYLALLDFALGMEVFRLLCVFIYVLQTHRDSALRSSIIATIRAWAFASLIPLGFLFWRLFIFHNERPQTDVGRQLGVLLSSPFATAVTWLIRLVQSAADIAVFSWVTPVLQQYFNLRLKGMLLGGALAALVVAAFYVANQLLARDAPYEASAVTPPSANWTLQAILAGLVGVFFGVVPVIIANRYADFQSFSHYALPASLAGAMFLVGLISSFRSDRIALHALAVLVACAVLTHFAYSLQVVDEEQAIAAFWHQVAWRVPQLTPGTTIYVNYPGINYGDNADAADGPANFIYFPQQTREIPVTYQVMALPQSGKTTNDIVIGRDQPTGYRTHVGTFAFDKLLVLSQPSSSACVHAINGKWPLISGSDPDQIRLVGNYSKADSVIAGSNSPIPATFMFGPEPAHRWCYYFEKADLALQSEDWSAVGELGRQATAAGLHPEDWIEWMPFLQSYAVLGDEPLFTATAHRINGDPYARIQACSILTGMQSAGYSFSTGINSSMADLLCRGE